MINHNILEFTPLVSAIGWTIIHTLWQFSLIGLLTYLLLRFVPLSRSNLRYILLVNSLSIAFIWSGITFYQNWSDRRDTSGYETKNILDSSTSANNEIKSDQSFSLAQSWNLIRNQIEVWIPYLALGWLIGMFLSTVYVASGIGYLYNLKKYAKPLPSADWIDKCQSLALKIGVKARVNFRISEQVKGPITFQLIKPLILIPSALLTQLPAPQIEVLILHELAHIRRYDFIVNIFQVLIESIFFYHPLIWWISACVREEREHCCDDLVMQTQPNPHLYAFALTQVSTLSNHPNKSSLKKSLAMSATHKSSLLRKRIFRMYGHYDREPSILKSIIAVIVLSLCFSTQLLTAIAQENPVKEIGEPNAPSKNEQAPLYIVDGEIQEKQSMEAISQKLSPDDIESIKVLKGQAAIQKYGSQAINGAVEIYTKDYIQSQAQKELGELTSPKRNSEITNHSISIDTTNELITIPVNIIPKDKDTNKAEPRPQIEKGSELLWIIDGEIKEDYNSNVISEKVPVENIKRMEIIDNERGVQLYGTKAKQGVVKIWTKDHQNYTLMPIKPVKTLTSKFPQEIVHQEIKDIDSQQDKGKGLLWIIDGEIRKGYTPQMISNEITKAELESIELLSHKRAVELYGPSAKFGAIKIWTTEYQGPDHKPKMLGNKQERIGIKLKKQDQAVWIINGVIQEEMTNEMLQTLNPLNMQVIQILKKDVKIKKNESKAEFKKVTMWFKSDQKEKDDLSEKSINSNEDKTQTSQSEKEIDKHANSNDATFEIDDVNESSNNTTPLSTLLTPYSTFEIYPNPTQDEAFIEFDLTKEAKVKVEVHSLDGKLLSSLLNKSLKVGHQKIHWKTNDYSKGIYTIKLYIDNEIFSKQLIIH